MPICFALIGLTFNIFVQIYENQTTLESMGNTQRRFPCIGIPGSMQVAKPNPYDLLWPNNLRQVMGSSMLTWPIPFYQPEMKGRGFYYPKIPEVRQEDIGIFNRDGNQAKKKGIFDIKDQFESSPEDYIKKAKKKYQGYRFQMPP